MPACRFTDRFVRGLKAPQTRIDYWDDGFRLKGFSFGMRVSETGLKTYSLRYRKNGVQRRYVLGTTQTLLLAQAHKLAREVAGRISAGEDPSADRASYKRAETCAELFDLYLKRHAAKKKDGGAADRRIIETDLSSSWGTQKACDIKRRDVIDLLHRIASDRNAPVMANRTRALISKIFNFALELEIVGTSPCAGLPRKFREKSKERVLSEEELGLVWNALDKEAEPVASVFRLILLTVQRPGEVAASKWSEFDTERWLIPAERVKNGRSNLIPIVLPMKRLLTRLKLRSGGSAFVFPTPRSDCVKARTMQHLAERLSEALKIPKFTPHDLRRSSATLLRKLKVPRDTVSAILNHTAGSVTLVYDRYAQEPEIRAALLLLGQEIERIAIGVAKKATRRAVANS